MRATRVPEPGSLWQWCALVVLASCMFTGFGCVQVAAVEDDVVDDDPYHRSVQCPPTLPEMRLGMSMLGDSGNVRAELVDADYVPVQFYYNTWTVELSDTSGNVLPDAVLTDARTFMPLHNHDGQHDPEIKYEAGQVEISELNLWMEGPWEIELWVSSEAGDDYIVFEVCLEETRPDAGAASP